MQENNKAPDTIETEEDVQAAEEPHEDLPLVEAALYVSGRPLDLNEICSVLKTRSKNRARKTIEALIQEYSARRTALEILELKGERYVLQLKVDFTPHVKKLVNRPLLSMGPLKTLSYIAYKQPISQKRVIEVRGRHAYGHIRELKNMGLLGTEHNGRSTILKTTEYFADYFGLSPETPSMKKELKQVFQQPIKQNSP